MPAAEDTRVRMPHRCPACDRVLYSSAASRPELRSTLRARILLLIAGTLVAAVYLVLLVGLREKFSWRSPLSDGWVLVHYPPVWILSIVALPIALVPGIAIGWLAARMPKVRIIRCWKCRWSQVFPANALWQSAEQ
jgi:hypothetical protein